METLIKVYAKVALQEPEFVEMVEETGKHIEDSIAVAKKYYADNVDETPIIGFVFKQFNPDTWESHMVFECDINFDYMVH